jgi:hypothetical protein
MKQKIESRRLSIEDMEGVLLSSAHMITPLRRNKPSMQGRLFSAAHQTMIRIFSEDESAQM